MKTLQNLCGTSAKLCPSAVEGSGSFIFEPRKVDLFNFQSLEAFFGPLAELVAETGAAGLRETSIAQLNNQ